MIKFYLGALILFLIANMMMGPFWKWGKVEYESLMFGSIVGLITYQILT